MSAPEVSGDNHSLATKCLDICQALSSQGKEFSFSLNFSLNSSFTFTLDTREKDTPSKSTSTSTTKARKKVSPSTQRRNARRKEEFLRKKKASQESDSIVDLERSSLVENSYKCNLCEKSFSTEPGLKIHKGKSHKGSELPPIQQLRDNSNPHESSLKVSPAKETRREEEQDEEDKTSSEREEKVEEPPTDSQTDTDDSEEEEEDYVKRLGPRGLWAQMAARRGRI